MSFKLAQQNLITIVKKCNIEKLHDAIEFCKQ